MKLNLPILPLDVLDSLSYQKCLIPKDKFPRNVIPGQWAKCYFFETQSETSYYSVTQIFPREDLDSMCCLDICVANFDHKINEELILDRLELLQGNKEIKVARITFRLNPKSFIENSNFLNEPNLLEMAKTLLKKYYLTDDCTIRDKCLLDSGIDSIHIKIEDNYDGSTFIITDDSDVYFRHVYLTQTVLNSNLLHLNAKPFAQARQDLNNLMKCFKCSKQLFHKRPLCMNWNAILVGAVGCGKTTLAEQLFQSNFCNVFYIKISDCLKQYPGEAEAELRKIFKAACDFENFKAMGFTVIFVEEIHLLSPQHNPNNPDAQNYLRIGAQLLSLVDGLSTGGANIMCLATTSNPDNLNESLRRPGRFGMEISIPALREEDREDILLKLFKQSMPNFNLNPKILESMIKQTQGYVLADLALLVRNSTHIILTKSEENFENIILDFLRKSKPMSLKGTDITAYKTKETFDSIGGMLRLKNILEVSVLAGIKQHESFKRFKLHMPKGILLYGPPGCAKTTIAKCLATEANMNFVSTCGAELYSPYVGCAEKFIVKLFQTARQNAPCLIFLDEIDSIVGRRALVGSSNSSDVQIRILSTLLTEMDGVISPTGQSSNIIVVAATNRPDMVDDALLRPGRFDKLIHVPAPDLLSRRSILNLYKHKMPFSESIDINYLAIQTENYSGADICNLCNEAALQAFQRNFDSEKIIMDDFKNVLETSKSSLDRNQIDSYYKFENKCL